MGGDGAGPADYAFGDILGEGAFATVLHARRRSDGTDFAVKVMIKSYIEREGKTRLVLAESKALQRCASCDFVVNLSRTFQDADYLFFVLEFCGGGDLLHLVNGSDDRVRRAAGGLTPYAAAFYAAEVVLGLEFLRSLDVAHRDLKPENVLLDGGGHAKLADFGAVLDCSHAAGHDLGERHGSFEGTAEYVSPEVLQGFETTPACDLWALGCLCYQLSCGALPFRAATDFLLWEKIVAFADGDESAFEVSPAAPGPALDLARRLLVKDAAKRLGADDVAKLYGHAFFAAHFPDVAPLRARPPVRGRRADAVDWASLLDGGETLLDRGVLWKRKGLFWRERVFLLTSAPRFVYYDCSCDPPEQKGAIPWTYEKPVHCRRRSATHFDVVTEHRDYHLAAPNAGGADAWIRALHDALARQAACHVTGFQRLALGSAAPRPDEERGREGWLWKQGAASVLASAPSFKRRYAVLRGVQLFYYRAKPEGLKTKPPAGVVRCRAARPVPPDRRHPGKFAFDVDADTGRTFHIFVDDADDRAKWLDALAEVIAARDSRRHLDA
ncbi:3-phosphoinositide-dependent protein kinase [Aureococcus anophagefferens]|uniref:non-specific serine/threonine protein kinase n=2 Tax=Aureococcus anophagefferens TaxID=44056 RepID=A0ABR1FTY4_AURAN